jgi:zinc transport system ATP-binding protein
VVDAASPILVEALGVDVRVGGRRVLEHIDLSVETGRIVTVIGPNGAGKTTLVRVVLGLVEPSAGTVHRRPGMRVGYVPQHLHIDHTIPLSVRRFLALAAPGTGHRAAGALAEVGAAGVLGRPFQALSGGEAKRVLLAQALLRDPDLLVLDEPGTGVDVGGQAELFALLDAIRGRRGCGILLVSHDLHLVMAASDRVLCINRHVCCTGRPDAVSRHPEYRTLFGLGLGTDVGVYTHAHDHDHALSGEAVAAPGAEDG